MSRRAARFLIAVFLILSAQYGATAEGAQELREEQHQSFPLKSAGRVSLKNFAGSVRITGWDRDEVKVDVVKRAPSAQLLAEAEIKIEATADSITIRTGYPDECCLYPDDNSGDCCSDKYHGNRERKVAAVDYVIAVPRGVALDTVELVKGSLVIEGVTGKITAATVTGPLEVRLDQLSQSSPVTLNSVIGPVSLQVPSDAEAQVAASTLTGTIQNDFGLAIRKGGLLGREIAGKLGEARARIRLESVTGAVTLRRAADGRALRAVTNLEPDKNRAATAGTAAGRIAARARVGVERAVSEAQTFRMKEKIKLDLSNMKIELPHIHIDIQPAQPQVVTPRARAPRAPRARTVESAAYRLVETESKSFPVKGVPQVNLNTFDGSITVRGWDKAEVMINATKRARDEEAMQAVRLRAEQNGEQVTAAAEVDGATYSGGRGGATVAMEVFVPRNANLQITSGDGNLNVESVAGQVELRTEDGQIEVTGGRGRLRVTTGDGRIQVVGFDGELDARTQDGQISLGGRFASLSARTGGGSISLSLPASFDATVETSSPSIVVDGLRVTGDEQSPAGLRRWKIGKGGTVLSLQTADGRIILRRAGG